MKIAKPRSKPPLGDAITLVEHAIDMAQLYVRDTDYIPTAREVQQADSLADCLLLYSGIVKTIAGTLRKRLNSSAPRH